MFTGTPDFDEIVHFQTIIVLRVSGFVQVSEEVIWKDAYHPGSHVFLSIPVSWFEELFGDFRDDEVFRSGAWVSNLS